MIERGALEKRHKGKQNFRMGKGYYGIFCFFRVFLDIFVYRVSVKRRLKPKSWVMVG